MILRAKNWREFQHYSDRTPGWIKLHKRLLDDRTFHRLPDASRALAPMLWLLASESVDGIIVDAVEEIAFRLRMTEQKADAALKPLIEAGFFIVEQADSAPLADGLQDACLEERREREEEEERAFAAFVEAARKREWPKPQSMTADRRKKLRARLDEHGIAGWEAMIARASASDFLCSKFALKFDWVLEPKNFTKVIEGNYDAKPERAAKQDVAGQTVNHDADSQWRARISGWRPGKMWLRGDWGPEPGEPGCRVPGPILAEWREQTGERRAA